ncbi:hypothetical protein KIPB_010745, partial [Kipferlia bialata]|eukprot:g10745.t1
MAESFALYAFSPEESEGSLGNSSCKYNSKTKACDGKCSDDDHFCVETSKGHCTCTSCAYDYST